MDLVYGLSAAKLALDIAKDLRSIDRSVDDASFKLKLAELTSALADAKVALSDAKIEIDDLTSKLREMTDGTLCPKCRRGRLTVVSVEQHEYFDTQFHKVTCNEIACGYAATRTYDPTRALYTNKSE